MSTTIGNVNGEDEIPLVDEMKSKYEESELSVNSFFGGVSRGRCAQLTMLGGYTFIQLDEKGVDDLIDILQRWKNGDY